MRWLRGIVGIGVFVAGVATVAQGAPVGAAATGGPTGLEVYEGRMDAATLGALRAEGVDVEELPTSPDGSVEVVLAAEQARRLAGIGIELERRAPADTTAADPEVFRPYSGAGGLKEDLEQIARDHPGITELVKVGKSVRGKDIVALRVTRRARDIPDGRRPASLFLAGQHAREWIAPETVRRLAHLVVDGDRTDPTITKLIDTTEVWFLPVVNPDGYDFSFTPGNRNWRKNLRDNDGDGRITAVDGVDLNRNLPTRWFYDDEGSSSDPVSEIYRGPSPASEPETRAVDRLLDRVEFEFVLNYHSAAEKLLYGESWQVSTPTPDDLVYEALAGDDAAPAVPGYDPDILSELYTANGELGGHAHSAHGSLALTPEMSACQTVSAAVPGDRWEPAGCASAFTFPDDEALIEAEFRKNVPFALATARSAVDPDHPVSVTGRTTPEFVVDRFDVSYGDPQTVAVTARRDQRDRRLNYRVNGGRTRSVRVAEWEGGERYGDSHDRYYAEFRGDVTGTRPGDRVEVWFSADASTGRGRRAIASEHFTYTVAADAAAGAEALIVANEDYRGVNPTYPAGTTGPKYVDEYAAALAANGVSHATWDVDAQGVPHPLGVLSHFDTVVWETGDNRLTQDPEDALTPTFLLGPVPDISVAERQQYLTMAVRDYLNEGGKLVHAGENAQYMGLLGRSLGAVYYGLNGAPDKPCAVTRDFLADCLLLTDDFAQYYLGARDRAPFAGPTGIDGRGTTATFGGPAVTDNPLNEAGAFTLTSDDLPADDFPLFAGEALATYRGFRNADPFAPVEGARYAAARRATASYQRIGRSIDLSGVTAAEAPRLNMKLSFSTLVTFHAVIVEAAPAGTDRWTTLRDLNGRTSPAPPTSCADGNLVELHPFLLHYLTPGRPCRPTGTTGAWNAFTAESGGWVDTSFDLSAFAGGPVDVKVSYVTDSVEAGVEGGIGVFVDDTRVTVGGAVVDADGFETDGGAWSVEGPPPGSPPVDRDGFVISGPVIRLAAAIGTEDTALIGTGLESIAAPTERAAVLGRLLDHIHPTRR